VLGSCCGHQRPGLDPALHDAAQALAAVEGGGAAEYEAPRASLAAPMVTADGALDEVWTQRMMNGEAPRQDEGLD